MSDIVMSVASIFAKPDSTFYIIPHQFLLVILSNHEFPHFLYGSIGLEFVGDVSDHQFLYLFSEVFFMVLDSVF